MSAKLPAWEDWGVEPPQITELITLGYDYSSLPEDALDTMLLELDRDWEDDGFDPKTRIFYTWDDNGRTMVDVLYRKKDWKKHA